MVKHAGVRHAVNAMLALSICLAATFSWASYALTFVPAREAERAKAWTVVPAVIVAASDHQDDGYRCRFAYTVDGRTYESERDALKPVVVTHPWTVGAPATCFVDPEDPTSAVMDRETHFSSGDGIVLAAAAIAWAMLVKALLVRFSILRVRVDVHTKERLTYREMSE